jgi:deazaflavin-dependent oxidoreductase (nitroreductase family)
VKLGVLPLNVGQAQEDGQPVTFPRALARYTRGAVNTMTLRLAGHAGFADLEHTGRKSGTVRHTPVRAFRAGETVVVGLNFGPQSDWYQNIKAAGTSRMRLGGELLTLGRPELVPAEQGVADMPWPFRFALRHVIHTADCVRLPILDTSGAPAAIVNPPSPAQEHRRAFCQTRPAIPHAVRDDRPEVRNRPERDCVPSLSSGPITHREQDSACAVAAGGHAGVPGAARHVGIVRLGGERRADGGARWVTGS